VTSDAVAVVMVRDGRLPAGAHEAVAEVGGSAIVVGSGAEVGAAALVGAGRVRWSDTGPGLAPGRLARLLAPVLTTVPLVVLPASPDGRDLAPRLAAELGRPLVARATATGMSDQVGPDGARLLRAVVARLDDRVQVAVDVDGPAVVTVGPGGHVPAPTGPAPILQPLDWAADGAESADSPGTGSTTDPTTPRDPEVLAVLQPDLHTMDLADATRVFSGGAGLAAGEDDRQATRVFDMLVQVAATMGGSAGATRVATDAGWTGYERQIGTTGVAIDPDLYVAFGVSGASQHIGGLGTPRHIVSVNIDGSCPMTAMADLGLVTDARELLTELAGRFGIEVPAAVEPDGADGAVAGPGADELKVGHA
jgi:electron transfer flavoprotein alpha subunit